MPAKFYDALTMASVADELRSMVLGGRVQQVLLPDNLAVGLEIYAQRQRHYLLASAHAELARLLLASEKLRRGVDRETGMLLLLRKHVRGATLSAIEQPPFERILHLEFDHPEWGCTELVIELMGRHSNIILLGPGERVLDAVKRVGRQMSAVRTVLPGQAYMPPPSQNKLPPSALTEYRLRQILADREPGVQLWQALVAGIQGMSPLLAREIAFRTLGHPRAKIGSIERLAPLLQVIAELLSPLESGRWQPTVVLVDGEPEAYAPYPVRHLGDPRPLPTISRAIEAYFNQVASVHAVDGADPYAAAKRPVREAISSARARLERRKASLVRSLNEAAKADRWRQWGEWILAYAHTIARGDSELVADTGAGELLHIPLDPGLSPADNAQAYFDRYRKAQRAARRTPHRLDELDLALQDLDQLETDLELVTSRPEIEQIRRILIEEGYVRSGKARSPRADRRDPLSLVAHDGSTILVGRNSRQNDQVTFRQAKPEDWWFHARGVPGAHVIVRSQGQPLSPETVQQAAGLAAYFSRLRDEPDVPVDYTQRRHVRRIPGAAPGLVTYSQEQTVRVQPQGPDEISTAAAQTPLQRGAVARHAGQATSSQSQQR